MNVANLTVIYHSADFDGIFCREIARKFLPSAELIGWDYGDKELPIPDGQTYILDLSPDCLEDGCHSNVIWIDHHKSAIDKYGSSLPGYRIDGVAACRLAWQWFEIVDGNTKFGNVGNSVRAAGVLPMIQDYKQRTVNEPLAVRLAGEYDIWDKRDPDAELFQHGLRSRKLNDITWKYLLGEDRVAGEHCVAELLEGGKVLEFARSNEYRDVITTQGFDMQFEGLNFLACCSHELDIRSHLFEAGIKPHHDGLIGFTFSGKDWRVSMYGVPGKPDIDLSKIAVKHGGGGHKQACGFRVRTLPFSL